MSGGGLFSASAPPTHTSPPTPTPPPLAFAPCHSPDSQVERVKRFKEKLLHCEKLTLMFEQPSARGLRDGSARLQREDPEGADRPGRSAHCLIAWRLPGGLPGPCRRRAPRPRAPWTRRPLRAGPLGFTKKKNFFLIKCKKEKTFAGFVFRLLSSSPPSALTGDGLGGGPRPDSANQLRLWARSGGPALTGKLRTPWEGTLRAGTRLPSRSPGVRGRAFPGSGGADRPHRAMLRIRERGQRDWRSRTSGSTGAGWGGGATTLGALTGGRSPGGGREQGQRRWFEKVAERDGGYGRPRRWNREGAGSRS